MTRIVPQICLDFLKGAEACRLAAYQDTAGTWTIGVGHTGPEVRAGLVISQTLADDYLGMDARTAAERLARQVDDAVIACLTDHQYSAMVSFVFNLGAGPGWTIWKLLNARQFDAVPVQMLRFDHAGGREVPGLVHRRMAEIALWKAADVAGAIAIVAAAPVAPPPSSQTRAADTPPAPAPVKPLSRSKSFGAAIATAIAAAPVAIGNAKDGAQAVSDALSPYADRSAWLSHAISALAVVCAALALAALVFQWLKHRRAAAA